jgi:protein TonB
MSENNNKLKSLDEIVFEGRNKAYGAYDMRMTEKSTLLKAFIRGFIEDRRCSRRRSA